MLTLEQIKEALADRKLASVAKATGLSRVTVWGILTGKQDNPRLSTMLALSAYLAGE